MVDAHDSGTMHKHYKYQQKTQVKAAVVGLQDHLRDPKLATWMLSKLARAFGCK